MKKKQINTLLATGSLLILATLIIIGCKKNGNEPLGRNYFQKVMQTDKNVIAMETDLNGVSKTILTEAYLKRSDISYEKITNSLTPYVDGKQAELITAAKAVKNEGELKQFLARIGLKDQSESYIKSIKKHLASVQQFYKENPDFRELPQDQQKELLYKSMLQARNKKMGIFRPVQENDPCWNDWSEAIEDAQDDQFWEMAGLDVAFVLCVIATEGVGTVFCYDAYVAGAALVALHYVDNVGKADSRYNKCVGDVT